MRWPAPFVVAATLLGAALAAVAVAALAVLGGVYDVSAAGPHTQAVYTLLETTMRHSVQRRARAIAERPLDAPALVLRGAACYHTHCEACHGGPGVAPSPAGQGMQPLPGPLIDAARHWRARELVWLTRHGIRMSGMPAWAGRLADDDIWATVAFLQQLPQLLPADYARLRSRGQDQPCDSGAPEAEAGAASAPGPGDAQRGLVSLQRRGCHGCHVIPGVVGSDRHVGPPLTGYARRTLIAGRLPNTPANLAAWIRRPQAIDPGTAMPATPVDEAEALAMAAYLGTLR